MFVGVNNSPQGHKHFFCLRGLGFIVEFIKHIQLT